MSESDALALTVLVAIFGLVLTVLWIMLPFAVFDIKRTNRELVKAVKDNTHALSELRRDARPHTPPPVP